MLFVVFMYTMTITMNIIQAIGKTEIHFFQFPIM